MSFYKITAQHRRALGSADAAMFYLHIVFKQLGKPEVARRDVDLMHDLAMTVDEVLGMRKHLIALGVISVVKKGIPPVLHYSANVERFEQLMKNPEPKKRKKQEKFPDRLNGRYASTHTGDSSQKLREIPVQVNGKFPHTITGNSSNTPIYSIDTVVDKYTDSVESDFFETVSFSEIPNTQRVTDHYEIIQPDIPCPPSVKVFDLPEHEREELLQNLKVETSDSDWIAWLFDLDDVPASLVPKLMQIYGKNAQLFRDRIALYVLYAGKKDFRCSLKNYLWDQKYLEEPIDRRKKPESPKLTKTEQDWQNHLQGMAITAQKIKDLQNGNS